MQNREAAELSKTIKDNIEYFFNQAHSPFAILTGKDFVFSFANAAYVKLMNGRQLLGKPLAEAIPELDGQPFVEFIRSVFETGVPYHTPEIAATAIFEDNNQPTTRHFNLSYTPYKNTEGVIEGVLASGFDITETVALRTKEKNQVLNLQAYNLFMQAPVGFSLVTGDDHKLELANSTGLRLAGKGPEIIGKTILEIIPEIEGQGYIELLNKVKQEGVTINLKESPVTLVKDGKETTLYVNLIYQPYSEGDKIAGVLSISTDVTELVAARTKIEESEERLNIIIKASDLGTGELNLVTNEANYSERYLEMYGCKKGVVLSQEKLMAHVHPDDVSIRKKAFEEAYNTGNLHYEVRLIWDDNSLHWIDARGKIFFDDNKQPLKLIGTIRDVTEEKYFQLELQEREQKFRLLADAMPQFVWTGDAAGNLNYFNTAVYKYSGLTMEQIQNEGWLQIVHPDERPDNIKKWTEAILTEKDFLFEHRFRRHDGEYRWQLSRATAQRDGTGQIQSWVGTSTDIHEIKQLDQLKDSFFSMASHELKTPLTTIKAYGQIVESMLENKGDEVTLGMVKKMSNQVKRLTTLIDDLLDTTKMQKGKLVYNESFFDFNELVEEVVDDMQKTNTRHEIKMHLSETARVYGDRDKVSQVLNNMMTNAIKYSPGKYEIVLATELAEDGVKLSVQDFGIGISSAAQLHVFEQFYRVSGDKQSTFPGMGIGLYICAEIIKMQGGKIWLESVVGKGSTFYIWLP
ncbi:MAG: PAS domain-containing protein, partial [Ferruginibacter sp.]